MLLSQLPPCVATNALKQGMIRFWRDCTYQDMMWYIVSLIPRPSTPPAFDSFQYAYWKLSKAEGVEGLGTRLVHSCFAHR